ncbi:MAG: hypothetical protein Q9198_001640 [Flavoplaca austrocitrina]
MHWLKDCLENHEACRNNQRGYSPTRLLDVDQYRSSGDIVLVETKADPLPYTTLSHCWGPPSKGPLTTTLESLPCRLDRINFNELPQTFKDAVNTTRRLGIPYLWIDSLCIIQDSPDDWAKEASRMADVYAGALCTLAAVSSQDSRGGFFRISEKKMEFVFRYDLNLGDKRIRVFPCEPNSWSISGPLMSRAWTLQERKLSNRILYFKRGDLLWECATMKASADLPYLPYRAYDSDPDSLLLYDNASECMDQKQSSLRLRKSWFDTIEDYSARKMTYGKDKLIALSGLAHDYHERQGRGHYAAGIWQADMPSALLWRVHQYPPDLAQTVNASPSTRSLLPPKRPGAYRAPSWSWASVDGYITYDSQELEAEARYGGIWLQDNAYHAAEASEYDFGAFRVLDMQVNTSDLDPMGAVTGGHLILQGLVATAVMDEKVSDVSHYGRMSTCTWLRTPDGDVVGALLADVQSEVEPYDEIYCVSVRKEREDSLVEVPKDLDRVNYGQVGDPFERYGLVMGLGLFRTGFEHDGMMVYKRLGLIRWVREELFTGLRPSTIKVI